MNPNEHPLSERLERLLADGTPSGDAFADDLARTIPAASPAFQAELEDRLVAQITLHPNPSGDDSMVTVSLAHNSPTTRSRQAFIPLTLVAAMVAIVLVGSILLFRGGKGAPTSLAVVQESTPTPIALVNIVVALQDLPRGYQFPEKVEDLSGVVGYASWPESAVPLSALLQTHNGLEQLTGKVLRTDIFRQQPVLSNFLTDDLSQIANVGSSQAFILPDNRVGVPVPYDQIQVNVGDVIRENDHVDITATFRYIDVDDIFQSQVPTPWGLPLNVPDAALNQDCSEESPCQMSQTMIRDAIVVHIGGFSGISPDNSTDIITLAVTPDEARVLVWLVDSGIPLTIQPAKACSPLFGNPCENPADLPTYPSPIPQGMGLAQILHDDISNDLSSIQAGDLVDVTISFLRPAFEPPDANTVSPENGHIDTKTVFTGVKVYKIGEAIGTSAGDVVALLLTHPDMALLTALRNGNTPVAITLTKSQADPVRFRSMPDGRVSIDISIAAETESTDTTLPATVDILAHLYFIHLNPEDLNSVALGGGAVASQLLVQGAEIIARSGDTATLAIDLSDQPILEWAIKSHIPITVELRSG